MTVCRFCGDPYDWPYLHVECPMLEEPEPSTFGLVLGAVLLVVVLVGELVLDVARWAVRA